MPLSPQEKESVVKDSFVLDCPWMSLNSNSPQGPSYVGSGSVSLTDEGFFQVKVLSPNPLPIEEALPELHWPIGEILGDEHYYTLEARDFKDRRFVATGLLPVRHTGPGGTIFYAKARSITLREEPATESDNNYLRVTFAEEIRFPANTLVSEEKQVGGKREALKRELSAAKLTSCEIEFQIELEKAVGTTSISAHSTATTFDEKTVNCIIDSFAFVTGNLTAWSILETWSKQKTETQIRARLRQQRSSRIRQPLASAGFDSKVWSLFDRYLLFGLNSKNESNHPLASYVRAVIASSRGPLDVEELVLSVSIESLLRTQYSELLIEHKNLDAQIEIVVKLLTDNSCLDDQFRKRVSGAMQAMKNPRAKDSLVALEKLGLIDVSLVRLYGTFRGRSAHGVGVNWKEIASHIKQSTAMLVLFYQLIFLKIGYQGPYTDYHSPGYPEMSFEGDLDQAIKEAQAKQRAMESKTQKPI